MRIRRIIELVLVVVLFIAPLTASATTYDVCGTLRYWDSRTNRDDLSKLPTYSGANPDRNAPAPRIKLYLYDMDGTCRDFDPTCGESSGDDLLQTTYTKTGVGEKGEFCFTGIGNLEDIYFLTKFESDDHEVRDDSGLYPVTISEVRINFGSGSSPYMWDWNITCPNDIRNDDEGRCDNDQDVDDWFARLEPFANIIQSAVDVDYLINPDSYFHLNGHSARIQLFYPDEPGSSCDGTENKSFSCDGICIVSHTSNHVVAHEIGHNLAKRALNHCGPISGCVGGLWSNFDDEKCVSNEGWADFVAGATYWSPAESSAWYTSTARNFEGSTTAGNGGNSLVCVSNASSPHQREGNVARFFWDLYDSTNGDGWGGSTDSTTVSFTDLMDAWVAFPSISYFFGCSGAECCSTVGCTSNRERSESDANGRNAKDFQAHLAQGSPVLNVNCLANQDNN